MQGIIQKEPVKVCSLFDESGVGKGMEFCADEFIDYTRVLEFQYIKEKSYMKNFVFLLMQCSKEAHAIITFAMRICE